MQNSAKVTASFESFILVPVVVVLLSGTRLLVRDYGYGEDDLPAGGMCCGSLLSLTFFFARLARPCTRGRAEKNVWGPLWLSMGQFCVKFS